MAFVEPVTLRSRGLRLEPLALAHAAGLAAAAADGALWTIRVTSVPEPRDTRAYIEAALAAREEGTRFAFAVIDEATERVLGTTSFHDILPTVKRVEIGYTWNAASTHGSGANAESKRLLLGYAFETLGCEVVVFCTHWMNFQSRMAITRLGAKQDGVLRAHSRMPDGSLRDTVVFSILKAEWPQVRNELDRRIAAHS